MADLANEVDKRDKDGKYIRSQDFEYMVSLKRRAQDVWKKLRKDDDTARGARVASQMFHEVDDAIVRAGKNGTLAPEYVDTYLQANQKYADYMNRFGGGRVGKILDKTPSGQFSTKASEVVSTLFDGTPEATQEILNALPKGTEAITKVRGAVRDEIARRFTNPDGVLKPNEFKELS